MPGVLPLSPFPIFADPNYQAVQANATITTSGSQVYTGFGNKELNLVINIKAAPTGTTPTLTFSLQEVDPGDQITAVGPVLTGAPLNSATTQVLSLPLTVTGAVQVSWTISGAGASFTQVYVTLVSKLTSGTTEITDGTHGPAAVKGPNTAAVAADPALVVAVSPNNAITTNAGPTQQVIHSNATVTTSGTDVFGGFGVRDLILVINITQIPTGSFPSITYLMQEVDPGDLITAVGAIAVSVAQVAIGPQIISIPLSVSGVVRISWIVTGAGTVFTGVYATLVTKVTTVNSGLDSTGVEHALLTDTIGRNAVIDPPDFGAAQGLGLTTDPVTGAQTANHLNSTSPALAVLSNTQAGYIALGGKFQFRTPAGAETDYALFAYQIPSGYLLFVDSVEIGSFITGAKSSTVATLLEWGVAANSSAVSLATTAPFPPIFFPIGSHAALLSSSIGDPFLPGNLIYAPRTPIVVQPSRYFHIILRVPLGNATANQTIRGFVTLSGFFQPVHAVTAVSPVYSLLNPGSPQTITVTLSSGGIGTTAITVDGQPLTNITVTNDTQVQGVLPAGTYPAGLGNVHVVSPSFPTDLVDGFTFSPAAPPTLAPLAYPLVATASGVGQPITIFGTGLSGVTFVRVGVALATGVSSTPTSVTFTPPVNLASVTPYNISVTTIDGTATLIGAVYTLPAGVAYCWYAPYGYNAGTGVWTDIVQGVNLSPSVAGMTKPTMTPSWSNGQAALTWSGTNALQNAAGITPQAQPMSVFIVGDITSTTNYNYFFDGGVSGGLAGGTDTGSNTAYLYANGTPTPTTTMIPTSMPVLIEYAFNTAGLAGVEVNNPFAAFFLTTAAGSENGFTIGSRYDGNATITSGLTGDTGLVVIFSGTPSVPDRAVIHGISQGLYATL